MADHDDKNCPDCARYGVNAGAESWGITGVTGHVTVRGETRPIEEFTTATANDTVIESAGDVEVNIPGATYYWGGSVIPKVTVTSPNTTTRTFPTSDWRAKTYRPGWDQYFAGIARAVSERADCRRARHGAVIVKNHRIVSTGYNGGPSGGPSCLAGECPRGLLSRTQEPGVSTGGKGSQDYSNCVAIHAEANAIIYGDRDDMRGATLYVTGTPCDGCTKLIKGAGIVRVLDCTPGAEITEVAL